MQLPGFLDEPHPQHPGGDERHAVRAVAEPLTQLVLHEGRTVDQRESEQEQKENAKPSDQGAEQQQSRAALAEALQSFDSGGAEGRGHGQERGQRLKESTCLKSIFFGKPDREPQKGIKQKGLGANQQALSPWRSQPTGFMPSCFNDASITRT